MTDEKKGFEELKKLRDELKDMPDMICYTPQCQDCGGIGCFHEEEQAWVCCIERKRDPGCGKTILTVKEYNKSRGVSSDTRLLRVARWKK